MAELPQNRHEYKLQIPFAHYWQKNNCRVIVFLKRTVHGCCQIWFKRNKRFSFTKQTHGITDVLFALNGFLHYDRQISITLSGDVKRNFLQMHVSWKQSKAWSNLLELRLPNIELRGCACRHQTLKSLFLRDECAIVTEWAVDQWANTLCEWSISKKQKRAHLEGKKV